MDWGHQHQGHCQAGDAVGAQVGQTEAPEPGNEGEYAGDHQIHPWIK
jgi:hypothetical protein